MADDPNEPDPPADDAALEALAKVQTAAIGRLTDVSAHAYAVDPTCGGNRDLFTKLLILRAEASALTRLCIHAGVFEYAEYVKVFVEECEDLRQQYASADVAPPTPTRGKISLN